MDQYTEHVLQNGISRRKFLSCTAAGDGMRALAKTAEKAGVQFFFNTPAKQLIQDSSGKVIGLIAQTRDGKFHKFMANKGVILAAVTIRTTRR